MGEKREQRALKPPLWLLSLPLFLVLYRNNVSQQQSKDKRDDDCEGALEDKRGDLDGGCNVEDKIVEGYFNREDKIGDDAFDLEDRRVDGEGQKKRS